MPLVRSFHALSLALGWVALTACASPQAPASPVRPTGTGWYCFEPHPPGNLASSCTRTRAACVQRLADAVRDERGEMPRPNYSSCTEHQVATCFTFATGMGNTTPTGFTCAVAPETCESERTQIWPDISVGPRCERWD